VPPLHTPYPPPPPTPPCLGRPIGARFTPTPGPTPGSPTPPHSNKPVLRAADLPPPETLGRRQVCDKSLKDPRFVQPAIGEDPRFPLSKGRRTHEWEGDPRAGGGVHEGEEGWVCG